jgi:hypothetical protein
MTTRYEIYFNPWAEHAYRYTLVKIETDEGGGEASAEVCRCETYEQAFTNLANWGVNVGNPAWGIKIHG